MPADYTFTTTETEILVATLTDAITVRAADADSFADSSADTKRDKVLISWFSAGGTISLSDNEAHDLWTVLHAGTYDDDAPQYALMAKLRGPLGGGPHKLPTRTTRTLERAEFLTDCLTGAIEGGIGYWSQVSEYRWWSPTLDGGSAVHADGIPNAYATIHEFGDSDPDNRDLKVRDIGVEDISRAIGIMGKGGVTGASDGWCKRIMQASRENDAGELDAGDYDAIVQVAMFGEVVYG